jgi:hypothetical protein
MADTTNLSDQQFLSQDPEVLGLQRQRQLANLLTGQAFNQPQGQMISGHYVKPSALQQALPMINAAIGGMTNANLDTKTQELAAALRGKQQEAMQNYVKASQGTPAQMYPQQAGPMPNGGNIPQQVQTPATGPNYGEMFKAGTSQYASPQLQAAAYKLLEPLTTKKDEIITQRNLGVGGGMSTIAEGQQSIPSGMESAQIALGLPRNPATWTQQERQAATNYEFSLKTAGANRQNINVQNQLPFKEQIQKGMAEDLVKNYSTLKNAPTEIKNLDKVVELAKSPAYLGSGAEAKLAITKFFNNNLGTSVNADKVANTEEMRSALFQSTMENLKKVDAQPSQMQQQIMQQAFGTIGTDPSAIPKIVAVYKDILTNKVMEHNARVSESETGAAKIEYPYNIKIKLPEEVKAPVAGAFPNVDVRSIDAILNSRGVK